MSNDLPAPLGPESLPPSYGEGGGAAPWGSSGPAGDGSGGQQTAQLQRYLAAILRHKWWIIAIAVVGTVGGAIGSRFVEPEYQARATLWIEISDRTAQQQGPIRTDELLESTGWIELLRSYVVLDHVVREQRLYLETAPGERGAFSAFGLKERFRPGGYRLVVDPRGSRYTLYAQEGVQIQGDGVKVGEGVVGDSVGEGVGFDWAPGPRVLTPGRVLTFTVLNPRDVAVELSGQIKPSMADDGGNFLRLSLAGTDPQRTTATLNALAERYVEVAAQLKRAKLDELTVVLEEQRRYAEESLRDAEMSLESFRIQTITLPSDQATPVAGGLEVTRDPVLSRFFDMKVEREQLRSDREAIDRVLTQAADSVVPLDALLMIPSVATAPALKQALEERTEKRAELRSLQQRYTSEYRPVQQLAARLRDLDQTVIPRLAAELRAQLLDREGELEGRVTSASDELRQIPPRTIEEARLQRQVSIAENLHSTLKQRYEEARLAAASTIPDIRVLDPAVVPTQPTQDPRMMLILLGFVGSLGVSVLGVIVLDRFDPRVRYPEQISVDLGLPILGVVPRIEQGGGREQEEASRYAAEAFRELRLNLAHAQGAARPLLLTVTSPESGDGKSFVTSNLASSFADQGFRTLIVDADIRRGALHRIFGVDRVPGLTDFLAGTASEEEVVRSTAFPSVSLIASGTRMSNGPELLSSSAMSRLLVSLRTRFDAILFDSPPLGAGADAYALGTLTRDLVVVVRTGATNRSFTEAKLELLDRLPIRVVGAVLNGTPPSKIYRYYSYLPGYEVQEEGEEVASLGAGASQ